MTDPLRIKDTVGVVISSHDEGWMHYLRVILHPDIQAQLDRIEQALCGDVKPKFQDPAQ